jgi:hypothetical protein
MSTIALTRIAITAGCLIALAGCASAPPATQSAGAATPASAAPPAAKPTGRTAQEIKMDELLDNPKAASVLAKHAPALASNPQLSQARGMTLAQVAGYPQAGLSPELVAAIVADINKL